MTLKGWKNKKGTGERSCRCGSWMQHWIKYFDQDWPKTCSVVGCYQRPTLGAHVYNSEVSGEFIVPMCDACNKKAGEFSLKESTKFAPANKQKTCEQ